MIYIETTDLIDIIKNTVDDEAVRSNIYHDIIKLMIDNGDDDFDACFGIDDAFDEAHEYVQSHLDEAELDDLDDEEDEIDYESEDDHEED